jgi:hypothetical protein
MTATASIILKRTLLHHYVRPMGDPGFGATPRRQRLKSNKVWYNDGFKDAVIFVTAQAIPYGASGTRGADIRPEFPALQPGQFPAALAVYLEMVKSTQGDVSNVTLAVLHNMRTATLT